ncbi:MAG: hypothetical protein QXN59_00725 [Candidatus Micrarchaeaceae archaeon]
MNEIYLLNHAIFSAFLSLTIIEVGISLLGLRNYKRYWNIMKPYLMPMWEINGTFAVFYVVAFEAMYPSLLGLVGTIYIIPALIAALFFILRNAFLAYSEYIGDDLRERRLVRVYSISTLVVAVLALSIFTSSVSGSGINILAQSISSSFIVNSFNILAIASVLLIAAFGARVLFGFVEGRFWDMFFAALGIIFMITAVALGPSYMLYNIKSAEGFSLFVFEIAFLFVIEVLHLLGKKSARILVIPWLFSAVMAFSIFQYPYMFGGQINAVFYSTSGAIAGYVVFITLAGFLILALSLGTLAYITSRKPVSQRTRKKA